MDEEYLISLYEVFEENLGKFCVENIARISLIREFLEKYEYEKDIEECWKTNHIYFIKKILNYEIRRSDLSIILETERAKIESFYSYFSFNGEPNEILVEDINEKLNEILRGAE